MWRVRILPPDESAAPAPSALAPVREPDRSDTEWFLNKARMPPAQSVAKRTWAVRA